jgi:transcriptional regulator GlxA family with amidase domain
MLKCWIKVRKHYLIYSKYNEKSFTNYSSNAIFEARRLLRYSDKSIKEIAYEIGYEDIQSFSRFLRKWKAFPSDFKRQ